MSTFTSRSAVLVSFLFFFFLDSPTDGSTPVMVKRVQMHMGTLVSITAVAPSEPVAQAAIEAGFREVRRLEQILSTWLPESELSRVNAFAGREPVRVSPETLELVLRSLEIARLTDGGFNIALGPAIEAWGVTERQRIPTVGELEKMKSLVDWTKIRLDLTSRTIFLPLTGMKIDVGGIGKGYAADRAVEIMKGTGATAGVVALSGDIKAFGSLADGERFSVGIQHPRREGALLTVIDLENEAISTAGDYERFFEQDGIRYHHILDPVSLQPSRDCQSVTVIAKEGVWADGLDTGIFVLGPKKGMELVERLGDVEAIIVDREGEVYLSSGLKTRVQILDEETSVGTAR